MLFSLNTDFTGLTQDQAKPVACEKSVDIDVIIEDFECRFRSLQKEILHQLVKSCVDPSTVINSLTLLPLKLKKEYEKAIQELLPFFSNKEGIDKLFFRLNPLFSFLDYDLLEYIIKIYGSDTLITDMTTYSSDMCIFMKETTIKQLINHLPGQIEIPPKFSLIEAKIGEDASKCTLEHLNRLRKRYCSEIKLSDIVFHLVAVVESNSFIVRWLVPSALVDDIVKSTRNLDQSFYQEFKITSLTLDEIWLFVSETVVDAMWSRLHVSDTNFQDQFRAMYNQIVYELEIAQIAGHELSSFLKEPQKYNPNISYSLSHELLNHELPVSVLDVRVLAGAIQGFGSDCLKSVMSSYRKYMSIFLKKFTSQQLISLSAIQLKPSGYSIFKYRITEPSQCTLDKLFNFRTKFCMIADFSELCFVINEVNAEMSGSFTVSWLVPPAFISDIIKFARNLNQSFYQGYEISSLTLDGMWLHMSVAEIDMMWSQVHVSDINFKNQFHTMCKQVVCEMKVQNVSKDHLSLYFQSLNYQQQISDQLSLALLEEEFPASFIDFRVLKEVIEGFGSDCLKTVMSSYCKYMSSIFTKQSTTQQLINIGNMSAIQSIHCKHFKIAQCKIMEEPSNHTLENLLSFRTRFCTTTHSSEVCFIMSEVNTETKGSFTVSWLVPPDIMKSVGNLDQSFYHENKITSLTLDGMWLHMSEAELEVMWKHMSSAKLIDQFKIINKQIVLELKLQNTPTDELSQCLMNQHPNLQKDASIYLSEAILTFPFPPSGFFLDFDMLSIVSKQFGSDCLRDVMMSYCKFMSGFIKQLTVQQLPDLLPYSTELEHRENFIEVECRF